MAQTATDVNLSGETLIPYNGLTQVEVLADALRTSMHLYRYNTSILTSGTPGSFATLDAITDGAFRFVVGETEYTINALDLSSATDEDDIAALLQTAIRTATGAYTTVTYNGTKYVYTHTLTLAYMKVDVTGKILRTTGTAIGNMRESDGIASCFDGINHNIQSSSAVLNSSSIGYVGKNWGAGVTRYMSSAKVYSSSDHGWTANNAGADVYTGIVTFTLQASTDNFSASIVNMGSNTAVNANSADATITCNDPNTAYRYWRVKLEADTTNGDITLSELDFYGSDNNDYTDIHGAGYLVCQDGGGAVVTSGTESEWLTWPEEEVSVVENPVAEDIYARIYWSGEEDELQVKGTFGTRDVGLVAPSTAPIIALSDKYTEAFTGQTRITIAGPTVHQDAMTLVSVEKIDVGYSVKFRMPEHIYVSASTPTFAFEIDIAGVTGWQSTSDIGTKTAQIDNSVTYAETELTSVIGSTTSTLVGTTYTWTEREVTFIVNMHYRLQTDASYYYLYTYVDDLGQESGSGTLSSLITRNAEERATISVTASTDTNIDNIRLYRTANSSTLTSGFYYVTELDNTTADYIDWSRDEDLVEQLSVHDAPVDGMQHLVVMPGGFAMAAKGKTLYVSEQYLLYSWLDSYDINFDSEIKALSVAGNECMVLTNNRQYLVTGDTPGSLTSSRLMLNQTCETSNRGTAVVGHRTLYPSPDGYVEVFGGQGSVITESLIQPRDWGSYNPDTFTAAAYDKKLYACSDNTFFIMDFDEGIKALTTLSDLVKALFYDSVDDILYCIIDNDIRSIDTNVTTYDNLVWRSKEFDTTRPWRPSCVRVNADSYPASPNEITLKLYAEGVLVHTATITSDKGLKIPQLRKEKKWFFEIESSVEILDIQIAQSIGDLQ